MPLQVAGFMKVRRALLSELSDTAYDTVQSFHSDSAVCFSIFLHHLPDLTSQHPPNVLLHAMEVICRLQPSCLIPHNIVQHVWDHIKHSCIFSLDVISNSWRLRLKLSTLITVMCRASEPAKDAHVRLLIPDLICLKGLIRKV